MIIRRGLAAIVVSGLLGACGAKTKNAVDSDDAGAHASMVLLADGRLAVSYYHRSHRISDTRHETVGALRYATGKVTSGGRVDWSGGTRVDGDVREGQPNVGQYTSLAIGPDGRPRISYYDKANGDLRFAAQNEDGSWTTEVVDSPGDVGRWSSLVLENGLPRIAYYDLEAGDLKFAAKTGSAADAPWNKVVVDGAEADVGKYCALASDGSGGLAIAYYDVTHGDLKYVTGNAGSFGTPSVVDADGDTGRWPALAFEAGQPRIAYQDYTRQDLRFARRDGGGSWNLVAVDEGEWVGADSAIAIGPDGAITIAYFDGLNNNLLAARYDGSSWSRETIEEAGASGYFNNVVLDADHNPIYGWYTYTGTEFEARKSSS